MTAGERGSPADGRVARAAAALEDGDATTAESLCLAVLDGAPAHTGALALLVRLHHRRGDVTLAETLLRRIAALDPDDVMARRDLALLLLIRQSVEEAELQARAAVRLAPLDPQAHRLLGRVMAAANRPHAADFHLRRALELQGTADGLLLIELAAASREVGRLDDARRLCRIALCLEPAAPRIWQERAQAEEAVRDPERTAALAIGRADLLAPGDPGTLLFLASLCRRRGDHGGALAVFERLTAGGRALRPEERLERGRLFDRLGRHDDAFADFAAAKADRPPYHGPAASDLIVRLKRFFTAARLATLPRAGRGAGPQPIFIMGFPRSGTTLIEQSLSMHPRIAAGDELPFLNDLAEALPRLLNSPLGYPEALADLWMGDRRHELELLRDRYLRAAADHGLSRPGAAWFTDKMPLNETHLGLAALLFPESPVIHALRHPLDVVLSTLSNDLTHGFHCANALDSAARHYVLVLDLVEHYRRQMPLRYLPVRYEDMVDDQDGQMRRILGFIGEDFDPRCLEFHENPRRARTASHAQVAERLYTTSCHRYRAYRRHLAPVIPILEPAIEHLGYDLD